jgi:hypothetical protein
VAAEVVVRLGDRDQIDVVGAPPPADVQPDTAVPVRRGRQVARPVEPPEAPECVVERGSVQTTDTEGMDLVRPR